MWPRTRHWAPSTDGRPIATALARFALGRSGLATGLAVVVLNAILMAVWDQ
jgi:hypothetical protein